jgi:hypothetical protein
MKNKMILQIAVCFWISLILPTGCTDDTWDKHYQPDPAIVSDDNLWTTIESMPELSIFAGWLKEYGYDELLSQSQAYTLFAPNNTALTGLDTTGLNLKTEWIENHLARFIIAASGYTAFPVEMLNSKRIEITNRDGNYFFGSAPFALPVQSRVASNGIIHVLDDYETFFPNIWEYLAKRTDLDSIRNYLYSYDQIVFMPDLSVEGSIIDGQQTYLDSVFVNSNTLLSRLGYINREDSSYVMIVPNNEAGIEAYDRIKEDFVYYNPIAGVADSLQRTNAAFALMQDLVFSNTIQVSPQDSLTSTSRNTFYNPQELFAGTEEVITSNGSVFVTDRLNFKPWESWHTPIIVEAERILGRENTLSTSDVRRAEGTMTVSGGRFLRLQPTTSSGNPTVTFEIPNTLSSVYNIYCVFVPGTVNNPNAIGLKPCKVYFNLNYIGRTGTQVIDRFPASGTIETRPYEMDTVLVAPEFKFPTANYGEEEATVTLKVLSNVGRTETALFSRELLLDCILLEPKKE